MSNSPPPVRRFAPQPVETTKSTRKFKPEPVEITTKSNRGGGETDGQVSGRETPRRRFIPEPVETNKKSNRPPPAPLPAEKPPDAPEGKYGTDSATPASVSKPRPRFAPQLIETTKRSRKAKDSGPALKPTDKTDISPGDPIHLPREERLSSSSPLALATADSPVLRGEKAPLISELRRARTGSRQHSWVAPTLDAIESSDSDRSTPPSLSTSPGSSQDSALTDYKHATRIRESCDDRFSGYLLALAAAAAEKQVREQAMAMAAYPNDEYHEPVDHFVDRETDDEDETMGVGLLPHEMDEAQFRRDSDVGMEMAEMRQHQDRLEQQRKENQGDREETVGGPQQKTLGPSPFTNAADYAMATDSLGAPKTIIGGWQKGVGLGPMRNAASPPMLGGDIKFPKCLSPQATSIETDQRPRLYTGEDKVHGSTDATDENQGGLWMGYCGPAKSEYAVRDYQSGLMTPRPELPIPISTPDQDGDGDTYMSGAPQSIDELIALQDQIEKEFTDDFVTQVYNYLSLGYPALARKFDDELSKISRIPQEELRKDDNKLDAKGFVRLSSEKPSSEFYYEESKEEVEARLRRASRKYEKCARWKALKLYVHEWARQQPRMREGNGLGGAVTMRRGSWAI